MTEKLFYTMGEVAEMFDVNHSLIRHWESQFSELRPKRNKKGNRLFTPQDVENLKLIYHLVKERGMTLDGARKALRRPHAAEGGLRRDAELMERLQRIRALLVEVREELKAGAGPVAEAHPAAPTDASASRDAEALRTAARRPVVVRLDDRTGQPLDPTADKPQPARRPRRKKEEPEVRNKELFAFYEQSLF